MESGAKEKSKKKQILCIWGLVLTMTIITILTVSMQTQKADKAEKTDTAQEKTQTQETKKTAFVEESSTMHNETDASGDRVPVPNGYVGSSVAGENEIDTGYVIYEGEEAVTAENVETARKTRNQYVWVPVPDVNKMYGTDSKGKKWGKLYNFSETSGDAVTGTSASNWSENSSGVMTISSKTGNREPDIVTEYDIDSKLKQNGMGNISRYKFLMDMEKEFNGMIESVGKYGGFYIGRYETGGFNGTLVVKGDMKIASQRWYIMYQQMKELKGSNENVVTGMIWGCQWDRTLMWLIESGNKTKEQICKDSKEWGNYSDNSIEYVNSSGATVSTTANSSTRIPTGSSEQTKANNIYDLAGNVWNWTMEAYANSVRTCRGGEYNAISSSLNAADSRGGSDPTGNSYGHRGGRASLYIK